MAVSKFPVLRHYRNWQRFRTEQNSGYIVEMASDDAFRHAAQKLHAKVYVDRQYVDKSAVMPDGRLNQKIDPHQAHSRYFVCRNNEDEVVAAARQIDGHKDLPTYLMPLWDGPKNEIDRIRPGRMVEISALVKNSGESSLAVLMLYRAMWQYSLKNGHQVWLMACDEAFYPRLKSLFGDSVTQIGDPIYYLGSMTIPAKVDIEQSFQQLIGRSVQPNPLQRQLHKAMVKFFLRGLTEQDLTPQLKSDMKQARISL